MESDNSCSRKQIVDLLSKFQAEDILIPISMTQLIDIEDSYEDILQIIEKNPHSAYPVYQDGIDDIIGILNISDLLLNKDKEFQIASCLRLPMFVSENTNVLEILEKFKKKKTYIALVVDEHGAIRGIVTQTDILHGIIEIPNSDDDISKYIIENDSQWIVDARLTIEEFNQKFNTELVCDDCDSIGGFVIEKFTYVPQENEILSVDKLSIAVAKIEGAKLQKLIVEFKS